MKSIAKFYTIFWIVYFPACIAFQTRSGYMWSDEILCIILIIYALFMKRYSINAQERSKEIRGYMWIMLFYILYSIAISVTTFRGVYLDFLQQIRPYAVFYTTWMLAPQFTKNQKRLIILSMLISYVLYLRTGNTIQVSRLGGEEGNFAMVALTCGMSYYLFSKPTKINKLIAIAIILSGLMCGKSKYIGQCVVFIYIVMMMKGRINFRSPKIYISMTLLTIAVLYFTWTKFEAYYITGMEIKNVEEMAARPATYKTGYKILWDYFPFGSGLGSFATAAAAKEYSPLYYKYNLYKIWGLSPDMPMFLADCFYPTLAEYGMVGIILFCIFWKRRVKELNTIKDDTHYKMAVMSVLALALDSTANTAYLSGAGMGLFMTLAICLNSNYVEEEESVFQ